MTVAIEPGGAAPALLREATQRLRRAGIDNAQQEARWLFAAAPAAEAFQRLVAARAARQPLQYLLGNTYFLDLELEVTPATLIPRPETELLVHEAALRLGEGPTLALDAGTGSGCVAIGLTRRAPLCRMVAVERSLEALAVARRNAQRCGVAGRVRFVAADWCTALQGRALFDALVSNPPYIPADDLGSLPPEVQHEPRLALDGGADGMAIHRRLMADGAALVRPGGWLLMEVGIGQAQPLAAWMRGARAWTPPAFVRDQQGIDRILVTRRRG